MADVLQAATSGRAMCRGCGRKIGKGELRFGESSPNPYGEGDAVAWFHVTCAACMRPGKLLPVLDAHAEPIADRDGLRSVAERGTQHERLQRLARAERAASGRAECRSCHEPIAKGTWRLCLQIFEEVRMAPIGFIHLSCAESYFGTREVMDRIRLLTPELGLEDATELDRLLRTAEQRPSLAKTRPPEEPAHVADARRKP